MPHRAVRQQGPQTHETLDAEGTRERAAQGSSAAVGGTGDRPVLTVLQIHATAEGGDLLRGARTPRRSSRVARVLRPLSRLRRGGGVLGGARSKCFQRRRVRRGRRGRRKDREGRGQ
jgi:hypothetical protein